MASLEVFEKALDKCNSEKKSAYAEKIADAKNIEQTIHFNIERANSNIQRIKK